MDLVHRLHELVLIPEPLDTPPCKGLQLASPDLLPVPLCERKWRAWNYVTFWFADAFNLTTFQIASSMIALGLNWWQAWLAVTFGYSIAAGFLVLNAIPGARHHIVFAAFARSAFGPVGSYWPVFQRAAMACVWYGVQSWLGGTAVYIFLLAIFPSLGSIPNGIPASGTDTGHFIGFFLFSAISLVPLYFPLHQIRHLFTLKAIVAPAAGLGLFGWAIAKAGGVGPIFAQPATVSGSVLGWVFVSSMMSAIANMATLICNATDFASRASQPSNVVTSQLIALPVTFSIVSFFGILISSSSSVIYGEFVWNPLDLLTMFLNGTPSAATRAGVAFITLGFTIAQLGTNVAANSISAGCDLTALMPRYINIRRGGYIAAIVGFAMCPWQLLSSSNSFTSYLSAFSVFLSSIIGVLVSNYWVVSKQRIKVDDLYTHSPEGAYSYWRGINLRAYGAYVAGIIINLTGFIGAVGVSVPEAATHIYDLSFFTGFGVSFVAFILLNKVFPLPLPTVEECENVTVGTVDWVPRDVEEEAFYEQDKPEKDGEKDGVVARVESIAEA